MRTRIIIEKDGERYEANDLTARFTDEKRLLCVENELDNDAVYSRFAIFPPVVRTDNSEVIARLERGIERRNAQIRVLQRENAKLRDALTMITSHWDYGYDNNDETRRLSAIAKDAMKGCAE